MQSADPGLPNPGFFHFGIGELFRKIAASRLPVTAKKAR
jgi:hypothetical protein